MPRLGHEPTDSVSRAECSIHSTAAPCRVKQLRCRDDCPRCRSKMKVMFREESGMRKRASLLRRKKASLRNKRNRRRRREGACVCVYVCVCAREGKREREEETSKKDKICKTLSYLGKKSNRFVFFSTFFFSSFVTVVSIITLGGLLEAICQFISNNF